MSVRPATVPRKSQRCSALSDHRPSNGSLLIAAFTPAASITTGIISALQMTRNVGAVRSGQHLYQQKDDSADDRKGDDEAQYAGYNLENDVHGNRSGNQYNERLQAWFSFLIKRCRASRKYDTIQRAMACEGTPIV